MHEVHVEKYGGFVASLLQRAVIDIVHRFIKLSQEFFVGPESVDLDRRAPPALDVDTN